MRLANRLFLQYRRQVHHWAPLLPNGTAIYRSAWIRETNLLQSFAVNLSAMTEERQNVLVDRYREVCREKAKLKNPRDPLWFKIASDLSDIQEAFYDKTVSL